MDERIDSIISDLRECADDASETFGALSADQLNWKPAADGWSVAQCLDHLILTNMQFYPEFARMAAGTRKNNFWQNISPFTGMAGRFLIRSLSEDSKKTKTPSKDVVPPSDLPADIVEKFAKNLSEVSEKIAACAAMDRKKTVVSSPFFAPITYTLDDAYTILVEHTKRHIRQAKRVTQAEGFPV